MTSQCPRQLKTYKLKRRTLKQLKTDQKTNTLVNKTTAVYEKIKNHENNLKNSKNFGADKAQTTQNKEAKQTQKTIKPKSLGSSTKRTKTDTEHQDKHQGRQNKQGKQQQQQKPAKNIDKDEIIDLTKQHSSRNTIKKSTLLIGSSILKKIKTNDLNENTAVRTIPGATIDKTKHKFDELNTE